MRFCRHCIALLFLSAFAAAGAARADCPLAAGAACDGVPCGGVIRQEGDVIYNEDYQVFQGCTPEGWVALSQAADEGGGAPTGCNTVGTTCSDGTYYAGLSPDGNRKLYAAAADAAGGATHVWGPWGNGQVMTFCASTEATCVAGRANTLTLQELALASQYQAAAVCAGLDAHGRTDWYLPARDELNLVHGSLRRSQGTGAHGFQDNQYWSSSQNGGNQAWQQVFNDSGFQLANSVNGAALVRCVRR